MNPVAFISTTRRLSWPTFMPSPLLSYCVPESIASRLSNSSTIAIQRGLVRSGDSQYGMMALSSWQYGNHWKG